MINKKRYFSTLFGQNWHADCSTFGDCFNFINFCGQFVCKMETRNQTIYSCGWTYTKTKSQFTWTCCNCHTLVSMMSHDVTRCAQSITWSHKMSKNVTFCQTCQISSQNVTLMFVTSILYIVIRVSYFPLLLLFKIADKSN